jgi:hypothetical protein
MLVEIEAEDEDALREGSILDHLTSGLVAEQGEPSGETRCALQTPFLTDT